MVQDFINLQERLQAMTKQAAIAELERLGIDVGTRWEHIDKGGRLDRLHWTVCMQRTAGPCLSMKEYFEALQKKAKGKK